MCVCVYACMHACMYVYMYVCIYVSTYVRTYVCMYVCIHQSVFGRTVCKDVLFLFSRCGKVQHLSKIDCFVCDCQDVNIYDKQ